MLDVLKVIKCRDLEKDISHGLTQIPKSLTIRYIGPLGTYGDGGGRGDSLVKNDF